MFSGAFTAIVTPFSGGQIDEPAFERLIDFQVEHEITGIVPVGTTGESPTLTHDEHHRVIELAVNFANGNCKVIAGTGSNSTAEAIESTRLAEKAGADAALLVAPYYNRPSQEGLFRHFQAISEITELPLILYSIPARCGVEIAVETVRRLAESCANIVAIKEAGGSVERVSQLRAALPAEFEILSGDDPLTLPFLAAGAVGVISVASNIIPREVLQLVQAFQAGKIEEARRIHFKYYQLFKDLFIETNPVPIKTALALANMIEPDLRLPLCEMSDENTAKLRATLGDLKLLHR
ncbi:MAG: 4-hydroxy-tetrahydrodipicolinate synthase [Verrucomicrobiota bacterium]|nr:4-hydroxy-tetrahydrodipicolinate synthase [Verrucomicrobiota bacterium]